MSIENILNRKAIARISDALEESSDGQSFITASEYESIYEAAIFPEAPVLRLATLMNEREPDGSLLSADDLATIEREFPHNSVIPQLRSYCEWPSGINLFSESAKAALGSNCVDTVLNELPYIKTLGFTVDEKEVREAFQDVGVETAVEIFHSEKFKTFVQKLQKLYPPQDGWDTVQFQLILNVYLDNKKCVLDTILTPAFASFAKFLKDTYKTDFLFGVGGVVWLFKQKKDLLMQQENIELFEKIRTGFELEKGDIGIDEDFCMTADDECNNLNYDKIALERFYRLSDRKIEEAIEKWKMLKESYGSYVKPRSVLEVSWFLDLFEEDEELSKIMRPDAVKLYKALKEKYDYTLDLLDSGDRALLIDCSSEGRIVELLAGQKETAIQQYFKETGIAKSELVGLALMAPDKYTREVLTGFQEYRGLKLKILAETGGNPNNVFSILKGFDGPVLSRILERLAKVKREYPLIRADVVLIVNLAELSEEEFNIFTETDRTYTMYRLLTKEFGIKELSFEELITLLRLSVSKPECTDGDFVRDCKAMLKLLPSSGNRLKDVTFCFLLTPQEVGSIVSSKGQDVIKRWREFFYIDVSDAANIAEIISAGDEAKIYKKIKQSGTKFQNIRSIIGSVPTEYFLSRNAFRTLSAILNDEESERIILDEEFQKFAIWVRQFAEGGADEGKYLDDNNPIIAGLMALRNKRFMSLKFLGRLISFWKQANVGEINEIVNLLGIDLVPNDYFLLDAVAKDPALKKLLFDREALLSEASVLYEKEYVEREDSCVTTERPPLEELNSLALLRLVLLGRALQDQQNLGNIGAIVSVDMADEGSEYGGIILPLKDGVYFDMIPPLRRGGNNFYEDPLNNFFNGGIMTFHMHSTAPDVSKASGPSGITGISGDLGGASIAGETGVVFTNMGFADDLKKAIRVNVDMYFVDKEDGEKVIDLGIYTVPYSKFNKLFIPPPSADKRDLVTHYGAWNKKVLKYLDDSQ